MGKKDKIIKMGEKGILEEKQERIKSLFERRFELNKEPEEELRAKVIENLSIISENWDEGITQALMVKPFDYYYAYSLCKNGLELFKNTLKILKKLIKLEKGSE